MRYRYKYNIKMIHFGHPYNAAVQFTDKCFNYGFVPEHYITTNLVQSFESDVEPTKEGIAKMVVDCGKLLREMESDKFKIIDYAFDSCEVIIE